MNSQTAHEFWRVTGKPLLLFLGVVFILAPVVWVLRLMGVGWAEVLFAGEILLAVVSCIGGVIMIVGAFRGFDT